MAKLTAHQLSTLTGIILLGIYIWVLTGAVPIATSRQGIVIGVIWLFMTIAFEFGFGHFVMDHSWARLFHDYNILAGRVWILVLVWTAISPYVCFYLRNKR